jgi:hypothetical protein
MSKKFHGQSHFKGGINIDESTISDEANYWARGAKGAYLAVRKIVGFNKTEELVKDFWIEGSTWKEICLKTEKILEDIREEKKNESH